MRIEAIYITYNIYTLLIYSSNSNCLEAFKTKSITSKNYRDSNKYFYKTQNIKLLTLLLIIIMRNISRSTLIIFSRENYLNRLISRSNSR